MGEYTALRLDQLAPNPDNPRETLGELDDLAASIAAIGVLQRLLVTPDRDGAWMVVDGHRRYWAMRSIEYTGEVPVEVREMDRGERIAAAVAAGTFTRPISPIDQARAFRQLEQLGMTRAEIEARTGCNQPMISTRLRLLELTADQQQASHEGRMSLSAAKAETYKLGRRAPDRAPRRTPIRRIAPPTVDGPVCEACGQPVPVLAPVLTGDLDAVRDVLAHVDGLA